MLVPPETHHGPDRGRAPRVRPCERVLVVDHEPDLLARVTALLRDGGMTAEGVADPEAALGLLRRGFAPDVILLEVVAPGDEYAELLELLREDRATARLPVVVMSTNRFVLDILRPHASGAIQRPFDPQSLFRLLSEHGAVRIRPKRR